MLESQGIPTNIPQDQCYSTIESYARDLLKSHDEKLRHLPNSIRDKHDAEDQMAALTAMRVQIPHFTQNKSFCYMCTDLHPSNIFIDQEFNIAVFLDLEWCCSLPAEMQHTPF